VRDVWGLRQRGKLCGVCLLQSKSDGHAAPVHACKKVGC
jgi:hypothetical protein